jgi:hypothetical protein
MWPFKNKEKLRANELERRLNELLDEKEKEKIDIAAALFAAEEKERLIAEEEKRQSAAKDLATEKGEPYINIIEMEMEPDGGATIGSMTMDWNVKFIELLQKEGYVGVSDEDAVDQWFRDVCRHVVLETYENEDASGNVNREALEDGRAEYS